MARNNIKIDLFLSKSVSGTDFMRVMDSDNNYIGGLLSGHDGYGFITALDELKDIDKEGDNKMEWSGAIYCTKEDLIKLLTAIKP